MRKLWLVVPVVLAAVALAGPQTGTIVGTSRSDTATTAHSATGVNPPAADSGVALKGATTIRVQVSSSTGTVSGGKVCAFYLPTGSATWIRSPSLDLTLPTSATELDGGVVRSLVLPDLPVIGGFGRVSYVACALTGTANDGGTNDFAVKTEAWGPVYPVP